jgi:hypothetical protein
MFVRKMNSPQRSAVLATTAVALCLVAAGGSGAGAAPVVTGSASGHRAVAAGTIPNPIAGDKYFAAQRRGLSAVSYLRAVVPGRVLLLRMRGDQRRIHIDPICPAGLAASADRARTNASCASWELLGGPAPRSISRAHRVSVAPGTDPEVGERAPK